MHEWDSYMTVDASTNGHTRFIRASHQGNDRYFKDEVCQQMFGKHASLHRSCARAHLLRIEHNKNKRKKNT
jgi:hypothetical protein